MCLMHKDILIYEYIRPISTDTSVEKGILINVKICE